MLAIEGWVSCNRGMIANVLHDPRNFLVLLRYDHVYLKCYVAIDVIYYWVVCILGPVILGGCMGCTQYVKN